MASDEDTELRDLVAQTLEANGVLGKIRAQLRSSVFLALEEQDSLQDKPMFANKDLKNFLATKDGQLVTGLVREFLEHFHLDFTLAVFDPESGFGGSKEIRQSLARDVGVTDTDKPRRGPLLLDVVRRQMQADNGSLQRQKSAAEELCEDDLAKARSKFDQYDLDKNGFIDHDELRNLFADLFPHFHKSMLERYVTDEFRAADKDLNNGIDFDEFAGMYKRLFILCRSVVSNDVSDLVNSKPLRTAKKDSPKKSGDSTIERKNKKNKSSSDRSDKQSEKSDQRSGHLNGEYDGSEPEDDPFFDDPLPKSDRSDKFNQRSKAESPRAGKAGKTSQSSALASLSSQGDDDLNLDDDIKAIDKKIVDLGFDAGDDDYDDDFVTNSNLSASNKLSARSDKSEGKSASIEEEIEEDISVDDKSGYDETTDQTISINEVSGFDYVEDVKLP